ncbi:ABC transporter ATP-binding protein [Armatimonas rosea]|uniref:ABC-2 type transport system ATP-binding protein n=1 Tax=Armatimonas rosea TaxID=685828 RepID=A0A7W9SUC4_ARMRO|nr:ABC transporter ATP-binding protein [Armatimonas rosea]MBB6052198.1 ABC-2 type transport system ATP-binding protein [Armatimonas rosea]
MPNLALETHQLRKVYSGAPQAAVEALDLSVPEGAVFGFLGPNGAGKTTTIGMLLGNVRPTSGSATVLGKPIGDRNTRRSIGYLPEKFQFHEFLTGTEFLDLHGRLYGLDAATRKARIPEALERVGLGEKAKTPLKAFSKGMQQRAGLAQAVLHKPRLVILDEPTSALDPLGRRIVRELIVSLKEEGTTVVLNSHLLSEVETTCDFVAIIRRGRVVKQGTLAELTAQPASVVIELEGISERQLLAAQAFGPVEHTDTWLRVETEATAALVSALVGAGAQVRAVTPARQSLEDAFIRLMEDGTDSGSEVDSQDAR